MADGSVAGVTSLQGKVSAEEWQARVDLAALYRLVALHGWDDLIYTHISARVPGTQRQENFPSTVAYVARLIIHRYAMLGVLDEAGFPLRDMGVLQSEAARDGAPPARVFAGKPCPECGNPAVIHKDGCDFCTACGYVGQCG